MKLPKFTYREDGNPNGKLGELKFGTKPSPHHDAAVEVWRRKRQ